MAVKKKRKKKVFLVRMRKKLMFVMILISAAMIFLAGRLIYINRTDGAKYEKEVLSQKNYDSLSVPYRRGDILDCNGTTLATSNKVYNLIIEPKHILEKEEYTKATTEAIVKYFGVDREKLAGYLEDTESLYRVAKKGLSYDQVKEFEEFRDSDDGDDVIGVWFEENYVRVYPYKELACHLLGFVVGGNEGLGGLEGSYNDELNGSNGRTYAYLNDGYNLVRTTEPPTDGYNIVTSIDLEIQRIVQKNAEEVQSELNAKNISVLVMRPKTCEVLALYNTHQYDPNDPFDLDCVKYMYPDMSEEDFKKYEIELETSKDKEEEKLEKLNTLWRSFVVSDTFEPGSTYKTFVLSGALENGVVTDSDTFYCDGHQQVANYNIFCSKHDGHGMQDLPACLANSCNDAFMQIGALMGRTTYYKTQSIFGFGERTNIDISGEMDNASLSYLVYDEEQLNETELATSAFGQSVSVTMLQLGTAFCSVINGGYYYQPHIVRRVVDNAGNLITNYENVLVRRTVSEQTSAQMRKMLEGVVVNGTGWRTQMEGYTIGGKTGTAEKWPRNEGKFVLSFIGFAPVEDPEVVIYCVVDEPDVEQQDRSSGATVLFSKISHDLFPYMNIYRTGDGEVATEGTDEAISPIFVEGSPTDNEQMADRLGNHEAGTTDPENGEGGEAGENGEENAVENGEGNAGENGEGNAVENGDGNAGENAGDGNAGENGDGNAGENGEGNAGENGDGNAGENGGENAGGDAAEEGGGEAAENNGDGR